MKYLILLIISLSLLSCEGQQRDKKKDLYNMSDPVILSDLEVVYEANDNYFSSAGSMYARHYMEESKTVKVTLTVEDKRKIFEVIKKADILSMPDKIERGGGSCILPSFGSSIKVKFGEVEKRIYDGGYCEAKDKDIEERYKLILNTIRGIVNSKEEVKNLPDISMRYM